MGEVDMDMKSKADLCRQMFRLSVLLLSFSLLLAATSTPVAVSDDAEVVGERLEGARATLQEWVEIRRVISKEERDLKLGREMLKERIELVRYEINSLREKIDATEKSISEADKKRVDLVDENDKLKVASEMLAGVANDLEGKTKALLERLPEPIRDRVKPLSQRLPKTEADTEKVSLAERFQNVIGILNEINKFNREITMTSEVRDLPDGTSAEVTALYIGLGQGYYASNSGSVAGVGYAGPEGWVWQPANEAAPKILEAIAILKNEQVADFVHLPIEIQ